MTLSNITIAEPANSHEIDIMMGVRVSAAEVSYSKPGGPDALSIRKHYFAESNIIADAIKTGKLNARCAKIEDSIVGMCVWRELDSANAKIEYLYVAPKYQNDGIGSHLFDAVLNILGNDKTIKLTTQSTQRFYEKRGFKRTDCWITDEVTTEQLVVRSPIKTK